MCRSNSRTLVLSVLLLFPLNALSSTSDEARMEPVVITASRIQVHQTETAQSIAVIELTDEDRKSGRLVYDFLRNISGVHVINTGGPGQGTTVQIRGANSEQTLVLLDGVPINDPTNPGRGFDFGQLAAQEIERIEVLRGAQSGIHGNNSTGGVIQLITKKAIDKNKMSLRLDSGSFATRRLSASSSLADQKTQFVGTAQIETSEGFPAANKNYGNTLKNGYDRLTGHLSVVQKLIPSLEASLTSRVHQSNLNLPYGGGPPLAGSGEDPNYNGRDAQGIITTKLRYMGSTKWEPTLLLGLNAVARRYDNLPDANNSGLLRERYRGRRFKLEQSNRFVLSPAQTFVIGLDHQQESITVSQDYGYGVSLIDGQSQEISGIFSEYRIGNSLAFLTTSARADWFSGYGDQFTYRVGPGFRLLDKALVLKGSLGKGFKAPSLFQLYSTYGDKNLRPEKSFSWDFGLEHQSRWFGRDLALSATYFNSIFSDLINFNSSFVYENIQRSSSRGLELAASFKSSNGLGIDLHHTLQIVKNDDSGEPLARRPRQSLSLRLSDQSKSALTYGISLRFTGQRRDVSPVAPYASLQMPSFTVFNADASYRLPWGYQSFLRLDNLFDRNYEEVAGYGTAGRSFCLGLQKEI